MKVMVIIKSDENSEAGIMPDEKILSEMGAYNEQLVNAGIMKAGEGLHPSSRGKRVRFTGAQRSVIDGPFTEAKELIAGFWIWEVKSMDEAVEWVKKMPNPMPDSVSSDVEIRPVFEATDFGEAYTPELQERDNRLREKIEADQTR